MIHCSKPYIGPPEIQAVTEVLLSGQYVQGKKVKQFESEFAKYIGTKYAIATNSGTSALHTALMASGIHDCDVAVSALTFFATIEAVVHAGCKPVFIDVDPHTYTMSPVDLARKITPETEAVIPVHLFGHPANMIEIMEKSCIYELIVIEDACQSHGTEYNEMKTGSLGDAGVFSFYATKNMTTGEGGMITTDDEDTNKIARILRNHGMTDYQTHSVIGYNYRMNEMQAAMGLEQLKRLPIMNRIRSNIAVHYFSKIDVEWLTLPIIKERCKHAWFWYPCLVDEEKLGMSTAELVKRLKDKGVEVRHRRNLCTEQPAAKPFNPAPCPVAESVAGRIIGLPIHPLLTEAELNIVVETFNSQSLIE